jgi:dCTP deaminase
MDRSQSLNAGVGIRPDRWIREFAEAGGIDPFEPQQVRHANGRHVITYGVSSYSYDARCGTDFKIITNVNADAIIDPKAYNPNTFVSREQDICIIPPNGFVLATTVEYFRMPKNVLGICLGKSTYARCGIVVNTTPIQPGFEGNITLELSNTTNLPAKIYAHEGIAQIVFFMSDEHCNTSYEGVYQKQKGTTLAKILDGKEPVEESVSS